MNQKVRIEVPQKGQYIIDRIREAGFEAYVVGGCVRDRILAESRKTGTSPHPQNRSRSRRFFTEP